MATGSSCPPGEAPLSVRLAWVGLELPLDPRRAGRQLAMTSGVLSSPREWWQQIIGLVTGRYAVHAGYRERAGRGQSAAGQGPDRRRVVAPALRPHARRQALIPLSTAGCEKRP